MSGSSDNRLRHDALGLSGTIAMSLAFIAPTIGVIFITSLISSEAGVASPFVFLLGTVGIALMAFTLAEFAGRVTSAGGFYKFITLGLGEQAGFVCGMMMLIAYGLIGPLNTNLFGGFVSNALMQNFGIHVPWWLLMAGVVLLVGVLSWYSVHASMQLDIAFLVGGAGVVGGLLLTVLIAGGEAGQVPEAFVPGSAAQGIVGIGKGFVYVVFCFLGFESCLTVAEETRDAKRNLPRALIGSVIIAGLFFTFCIYAQIVGFGARNISAMSASPEPLRALGLRYIGRWYGILIDIAALSATIAVLLATQTANFRILYAMGRDGLLPRAFGQTHPTHKTPSVAIVFFSTLTLVLAVTFGAMWGPINAFGYLGYFACMMILPIYILVNLALPLFIRAHAPEDFSPIRHILLPSCSSLIFIFGLYLNLDPWPQGATALFPWVIIGLVLAIVAWGFWFKRRNPHLFAQIGQIMGEEGDPPSPVTKGPDDASDAVNGGMTNAKA